MKRLLLIAVLILSIAPVVHAGEYDWQIWVHKRAEEVRQKKELQHRANCAAIKADLEIAIGDVSDKWPSCGMSQEIEKAITIIDHYYNKQCHWLDLDGDNPPHLSDMRNDLTLLRQYLGDCK